MLILGVIASLTIPSLIQNTQKREEVVKAKKGFSVLNQAFATHYALTGQDIEDYNNTPEFNFEDYDRIYDEILKKRMSITSFDDNNNTFTTVDGISFARTGAIYDYDKKTPRVNFQILTQPLSKYDNEYGLIDCNYYPTSCFEVSCIKHSCTLDATSAKVMNAKDPSKCKMNWEAGQIECN